MTKALKEGDVVWVIHNGFAVECKIMQRFIASDMFIVTFVGDPNNAFACGPDECYRTQHECQDAYNKKHKTKYNIFYDQFGDRAELFAFLFYGCINRCPNDDIAIEAALKRASEIVGIDMKSYFEKYCDDMRKEDFRKKK